MTTATVIDPQPGPRRAEPAVVVRDAIATLRRLDPSTAAFLEGLAFVMTRIADSDREVTAAETRRIESVLVECAGLPEEQAALVAEIARHRARMADVAACYLISRDLRGRLGEWERGRLAECLVSVAAADGVVSDCEVRAMVQVASELGVGRLVVETALAAIC